MLPRRIGDPLTHDLDRLIGLVAETGKDMTAYLDLGDLNPYAGTSGWTAKVPWFRE